MVSLGTLAIAYHRYQPAAWATFAIVVSAVGTAGLLRRCRRSGEAARLRPVADGDAGDIFDDLGDFVGSCRHRCARRPGVLPWWSRWPSRSSSRWSRCRLRTRSTALRGDSSMPCCAWRASPRWGATWGCGAPGAPRRGRAVRRSQVHPVVVAEQRQLVAHLGQPRDGARVDLLAQRLAVEELVVMHHRALVLVAGVDDRVELLQHPVGLALGADVVDVQQVDRGQAVQQLDVRALGSVGVADLVEQPRAASRSPTVRPASSAALETSMASVVLPVPDRPHEPQPPPGVELVVDRGREPARGGDDRRLDVGHRRAVERRRRGSGGG